MKKGFSLYCDLLRFCAAAAVYLDHLGLVNNDPFALIFFPYGHIAVIIFFVLSGYVIAYVTAEREFALGVYAASRIGRLYSVVLPAIFLTFVLDSAGSHLHPSTYTAVANNWIPARMVISSLFLNQSWIWTIDLMSNHAFWSLPYEFWYYVLFGSFLFLRGKMRILSLCLAGLLAGPKIILYLPIWLGGVAAYHFAKRGPMQSRHLYFGVSLIAAVVFISLRIRGVLPTWSHRLLPHDFSLADYAIAATIALNFYIASGIDFPLNPIGRYVRWGASISFSLYLFHGPLLYFLDALIPHYWPVELRSVVMTIVVVSAVALLSRYTEAQKGALKGAALSLFRRIEQLFVGLRLRERQLD